MERTSSPDPARTTVDEVMTSGVVCLDPDHPVGRARELMLGLGIGGLPVVDDVGEVVGFVTSSDLVEEWPFGEPVEAIMSRDVHAVESGTTVSEAAAEMLSHKIHHLLVVRGRQPIGLITSFDMLQVLADLDRSNQGA